MFNDWNMGDFDPYETLKTLDQEVLELKQNLKKTIANQEVLDGKLDDILRALRKMPQGEMESYLPYSEREIRDHSVCFDSDHHDGKVKTDSTKIKELIKSLTRKTRRR